MSCSMPPTYTSASEIPCLAQVGIYHDSDGKAHAVDAGRRCRVRGRSSGGATAKDIARGTQERRSGGVMPASTTLRCVNYMDTASTRQALLRFSASVG